jgi:DNA-binding transcriptional ArsR family regulator
MAMISIPPSHPGGTRPDHVLEDPEIFGAIASPVRRQILDLLAQGESPAGAIAARFQISRPAISQHLQILLAAGVVAQSRKGRENLYRLVPDRLAPVRDWIRHYERFWDHHLDRLQQLLLERTKT